MSETADRYRRQGLLLIFGGAVDVIVTCLVAYGGVWARATWPATWAASALFWVSGVVGLLGAYMLLGGSVLLLTADRPPFSRRRR